MAVQQARFAAAGMAEEQMWVLEDYGALLPAAAADDWYRYDCAPGVGSAAQSELTCNGGAVAVPSRKRGREDGLERYYAYAADSSAALLPLPGMHEAAAVPLAQQPPAATSRMAQSAMATTSGRPPAAVAGAASVEDALAAEMRRQQGAAEIDAIVRAGCDRLRAGLEQARKRHCATSLARAAAARALRGTEVELEAARRRAAELEERLRQAAAEGQAWRDVARGSEAVGAGLRATLEALLLGGDAGGPAPTTKVDEEGFGDSDDPAAADDAQSCCFVADAGDAAAATAASSGNCERWACRACGGGEAAVLLLPCRHLCLCKACEPLADACPVCLAAKSAAIHVAAG